MKKRTVRKKMTYGEAHVSVLMSPWIIINGKTFAAPLPPHEPRMSKAEVLGIVIGCLMPVELLIL